MSLCCMTVKNIHMINCPGQAALDGKHQDQEERGQEGQKVFLRLGQPPRSLLGGHYCPFYQNAICHRMIKPDDSQLITGNAVTVP